MKRHAPAADRNKDPILDVLRRVLPPTGTVLELASGSGQHAEHFCRHLSGLLWQPTDIDPTALASIASHRQDAQLSNLLPPLELDARSPRWPVAELDAVISINMVHISPWEVACGFFAGSARHLKPDGLAILYGPYRFNGKFLAPSNERFDEGLRLSDPAWGVRDESELTQVAQDAGFVREEIVEMPANNHMLLYRKK